MVLLSHDCGASQITNDNFMACLTPWVHQSCYNGKGQTI